MPSIIEKIYNFQEVTLNGDNGIVFNPTPVEFIAKCNFHLLENNNNAIISAATTITTTAMPFTITSATITTSVK